MNAKVTVVFIVEIEQIPAVVFTGRDSTVLGLSPPAAASA
jgi:hypothetical protein